MLATESATLRSVIGRECGWFSSIGAGGEQEQGWRESRPMMGRHRSGVPLTYNSHNLGERITIHHMDPRHPGGGGDLNLFYM